MSLAHSLLKRTLSFVFIIALIAGISTSCQKHQIAQWHGIERNAHYDETGLLDTWPENGPELLWAANGLGNGYAAPAITNNKIFVNGEIDSISHLFVFDLKGNLLWKKPNGREFMGEGYSSTYPGARSTPTVIDNLVYASSGMGRIACFDTKTGDEKWAVDIVKDFGGSENFFGYSESVVVDDKKVYCFAGGDKINLAALNRFTGETVWTSQALKDTFSYCSPILVKLPSKQVLVTTSRHNLFTVDCEAGDIPGTYFLEGYEYDGEHCNSPIYADGFIYFIANDVKGKGAVKLAISQDGALSEVWYNRDIRNNFDGYVVSGNHLLTTVKGNWLKALSLENGLVADSAKITTGSIIAASDKLICYGKNGDVNLVKYNEGKFEINGSFKVEKGTKHHFSHPVISNGILYIRHGDTLLAYRIN